MMNPFAMLGTLTSRYSDIRRALALYKAIQPQMTELIELGTDLAKDFGLLDQTGRQTAEPGMPPALRKYDTKWFQRNLNILMNAGLAVDGDLGPDDSNTRKAVAAYQEKKKAEGYPTIQVDGAPGIQTAYMITQDLAAMDAIEPSGAKSPKKT